MSSPVVGVRCTWRRRLGVLSVTWYEADPPRMGRVAAMVHLQLAGSTEDGG